MGHVVSVLNVDAFERIYKVLQPILRGKYRTHYKGDDLSEEEMNEDVENYNNLEEVAFETLKKAWQEAGKETRDEFRTRLVDDILKTFSTRTTSAQIIVMSTLYDLMEDLLFWDRQSLTRSEHDRMRIIVDRISEATKYIFDSSEDSRVKEEAKTVVWCMGSILKEKNYYEDFQKLTEMFATLLPDINFVYIPKSDRAIADDNKNRLIRKW